MRDKKIKRWFLLCGMLISMATWPSHAQEFANLFDVKIPQAELSPVYVPDIKNTQPPRQAPSKPDKEVWERSWYWILLEGIALGAARYNTEKQSDGRPQPLGTAR
jgi:hypothetical protein